MNNPNPFIPQGTLLEQKNKKRANFKYAVFSIFGFTALLMSFFLIQGCKKEETSDVTPNSDAAAANEQTNGTDTNTASAPPMLGAPSNAPSTAMASVPPPQAAPPPPPPVPPEPTTKEYVVVKGDSYYVIAKKSGVKMKELEAANPNVPPLKLKVGMKIQIPAGGTTPAEGGTAADTTGGSTETYTVKSGDTLSKIAKANGTTIKALRSENELKTDKIKVGQKLKVPAKAAPAAAEVPAPAPAPAPITPAPAGAPGR